MNDIYAVKLVVIPYKASEANTVTHKRGVFIEQGVEKELEISKEYDMGIKQNSHWTDLPSLPPLLRCYTHR